VIARPTQNARIAVTRTSHRGTVLIRLGTHHHEAVECTEYSTAYVVAQLEGTSLELEEQYYDTEPRRRMPQVASCFIASRLLTSTRDGAIFTVEFVWYLALDVYSKEGCMSDKAPTSGRLDPREAFGHPVTKEAQPQSSDHKPGYEDTAVVSEAAVLDEAAPSAGGKKGQGTRPEHHMLPPRSAASLPRTSLAERIRKRLAEEGHKP